MEFINRMLRNLWACLLLLFIVLMLPQLLNKLSGSLVQANSPIRRSVTQALIESPEETDQGQFGTAVAVDGDYLAVGAHFAEVNGVSGAGAVYLFQRDVQSNSGWTFHRKIHLDTPDSFGQFGKSVAIQGDILVVGAPWDKRGTASLTGAAYIFQRDQNGPDAWGLVTELEDEADFPFRYFGESVSIDGDFVAVGAPGADSDEGKTYLYSGAASWARTKTIIDPNGTSQDRFGSAVQLDGDTLVVGARLAAADNIVTDAGAAFVFQQNQDGADQWGLVTKLIAGQPDSRGNFGGSLSLDGDTLVVGADSEDYYISGQLDARNVGAAYLYERNQDGADAWGLVAKLRPLSHTVNDAFGKSVVISGDDVWIGAPGYNKGGFTDQGIMYQYQRHQGGSAAWGALPAVEADDGSLRDAFGTALATNGQIRLVGAPGREDGVGAIYVLKGTNSIPTPTTTFVYLPLLIKGSEATGTLADGGSLELPSGAIIGAVPGTLSGSINATIDIIPTPLEPLPNNFTPTGNYYHAAAQSLTITPADRPFLIGLPVPVGANPDNLAVAVLSPDSLMTEASDVAPDARSWSTSPGRYDAINNLFVITLRALLPQGVSLVLFEHPENTPFLASAKNNQTEQSAAVKYQAECDLSRLTISCTPANRRLLNSELEAAHSLFVDTHNFNPPALVHSAGSFIGADKQPTLVELFYGALIGPDNCTNSNGDPIIGQYNPLTMQLLVCMPSPATVDDIRPAVRHELFHAIQFTYPNMASDNLTSESALLTHWTMEGTAAAAEYSSFLMLRTPDYELHQVTTPITGAAELESYEAQDFWVYTGLEMNTSLAYLEPIFEEGATPNYVNQALPLADPYWSWAKNQFIEHHQPMVDAFKSDPCHIEESTVDLDNIIKLPYPAKVTAEGHLPPLTSAVVEIQSSEARTEIPISVRNDGNMADLRYKLYEDGKLGCKDMPDAETMLFDVPAGGKRYVLISNVSLTTPFDYVVELD